MVLSQYLPGAGLSDRRRDLGIDHRYNDIAHDYALAATQKTGAAAVVHLDECNGCGQCAVDCPFDAISVRTRTDGARWEYEVVVEDKLCAACGICVGSCHSSNLFRSRCRETGIDMPQFPIDDVRTQTKDRPGCITRQYQIIVFGCDHAFDVAELQDPNVAVLSFFLCTGMMPPTWWSMR